MVRGCGRGKGLLPLGWLWRNPARLLGSRRPLIPFPHQRVGFPPPLPHHHQHTENQQLLQFPWQQISLRFSPSSSQRREGVCTCECTHVCVHSHKCVGGNEIGEEAKQRMKEREAKKQAGPRESQAARCARQGELHLKDTYCMPGAALGT